MSSKTTNYNLHKIDLNDSPPDITVLNQNFDILDEKLSEKYGADHKPTAEEIGALSSSGGTLTGALYIDKDGERKGWIEPVTGEHELNIIAVNNPKNLIRYLNINATEGIPTMDKIKFIDNSALYGLYGEHNITKGTTDIGAGSALATGCIHLVYE